MIACRDTLPFATGFFAKFLAVSGMPTLAVASIALYVAYQSPDGRTKQD